jgi:hypothetical protein
LSISALLQIKINSNFNCSYMAMSSLTYIVGFSVRLFQPVYSVVPGSGILFRYFIFEISGKPSFVEAVL